MTQRKWKTTDGWEVLTGWDRPLQHYFLTISRKAPDGENEYLFDNLDDKTGLTDPLGGMTQAQIFRALNKCLTEWPRQLMAVLGNDHAQNLGNVISEVEPSPIGKAKAGVQAYQRQH